MVTAEVEEVAVQETQPEVVPDTPAPDVTEPVAETSPEDALKAFEAEIGLTETQDAAQANGTDAGQNPDGSLPPELETEVQKRVAATKAEEARLHQENQLRSNFALRANTMRQELTKIGLPSNYVEWVVGQFNSHHADAQKFAREFEVGKRDTEFYAKGKELAGLKADKFDTPEAFVAAITETAREGYVSKRDHEQAVKAAGIETYNKLMKNPAALRAALSKAEGAAGAGGGISAAHTNQSDEQILSSTTASHEQRAAAFERRYGFKP